MSDTIYIVYHSGDSIYFVTSIDAGWTWQVPYFLYRGTNPALDIDAYGLRYITWQQQDSISGECDVFYDCLDDYSPPVNVSQSTFNSIMPDVLIDAGGVAHIAWTEEYDSLRDVYYRSCLGGSLSDTVRLSASGKNSNSPISIFQPNYRVYVAWSCVDSASYTPYHIYYRYKETNWSSVSELAGHWKALRHPSLDCSHLYDSLAACWEDSTSDNLEATFYGGNQGGGYPTAGRSTSPVISTVGHTWSYFFWQEDSAGYEDVYCHLYYEMTGWYMKGSLRDFFTISEPIRYPNVCGAYLTWTQGDSPPYEVWFACFGYPIGVGETGDLKWQRGRLELSVSPNPFSTLTTISVGIEQSATQYSEAESEDRSTLGAMPHASCMKVYDVSCRLVKNFSLPTSNLSYTVSVKWNGTDDSGHKLPAGIYFVESNAGEVRKTEKAILLY